MSTNNDIKKGGCAEFELLMMGRLDGELSSDDDRRLEKHLEECPACRETLAAYTKLSEGAAGVSIREPEGEEWDEYWKNVANRLERKSIWVVVSIGAAGVFLFAAILAVKFVLGNEAMPFWTKVAVFALFGGLAGLFTSVLREKLYLGKRDKYRKVKR